jgi:hypothetical protein
MRQRRVEGKAVFEIAAAASPAAEDTGVDGEAS